MSEATDKTSRNKGRLWREGSGASVTITPVTDKEARARALERALIIRNRYRKPEATTT
ncbi:MAG: hypothetical protein ACKVVT_03480 [Dehalococcoidia bacterium]